MNSVYYVYLNTYTLCRALPQSTWSNMGKFKSLCNLLLFEPRVLHHAPRRRTRRPARLSTCSGCRPGRSEGATTARWQSRTPWCRHGGGRCWPTAKRNGSCQTVLRVAIRGRGIGLTMFSSRMPKDTSIPMAITLAEPVYSNQRLCDREWQTPRCHNAHCLRGL